MILCHLQPLHSHSAPQPQITLNPDSLAWCTGTSWADLLGWHQASLSRTLRPLYFLSSPPPPPQPHAPAAFSSTLLNLVSPSVRLNLSFVHVYKIITAALRMEKGGAVISFTSCSPFYIQVICLLWGKSHCHRFLFSNCCHTVRTSQVTL